MAEPPEQALRWEEGVPVSARYDDPYYSRADGLAETRHVFLEGNDLPGRWRGCDGFTVAELGFGAGLNFCAALHLWRRSAEPGAKLHFVSFELHPLSIAAIERALSLWPEIGGEASELLARWTPEGGRFAFGDAALDVIVGDARETLPRWQGRAQAWFLDGFAPARNPELWEPGLMTQIAGHSVPGATFATYSAAGAVRRALAEAGFEVEKRKGYGRKREMCVGRLTR